MGLILGFIEAEGKVDGLGLRPRVKPTNAQRTKILRNTEAVLLDGG
jgi:hypothetical protein